MILGKWNAIKRYKRIHKNLDTAIDFVLAHGNDMAAWDNGSYPIDGEAVYVNLFEYDTISEKDAVMEGHRDYADIHLVLSGTELLGYGDIADMEETRPYSPEEDFALYGGTPSLSYLMKPGSFAVCFPEDLHMPKVAPESGSGHVKKAVIKVRI